MRPKEITLSLGRTINVGNYNSIRVDASMTFDISDDMRDLASIVDSGTARVKVVMDRELLILSTSYGKDLLTVELPGLKL